MASKSAAADASAKTPPRRYLGLELSGAKNPKTALSALEYYPREKKIFLLDVYDRVVPAEDQSTDEALIELITELTTPHTRMGVNVPMTLPPCFECNCKKALDCTSPAVKWVEELTRRSGKQAASRGVRVLPFTPYTQRPIEAFVRYSILPELAEPLRFEVDEALGGNRAPLTARMRYLLPALTELKPIEVWPKLSVVLFAEELGLPKRILLSYRQLESGVDARAEILERICEQQGVFIYDRDLKKLAGSLAAFDSFICAYTAWLGDMGLCEKAPAGFPAKSGWIALPTGAGPGGPEL